MTVIGVRARRLDRERRELVAFLAVCFAISWGVGVGGSVLFGPGAYLIGVFGPMLAALWVTKRFEGTTASVWSMLFKWRVPACWYLVAVGLPLGLLAVAYGVVRAAGEPWAPDEPMPVLSAVVFFLIALVVAGGPEEPGWRGYALPRMQRRWNGLGASLVLGVIWSIWHAPLWFMPDLPFADLSFPLYASQILAMCVVYTWLFNTTGGSVLLAVILHASTNTAGMYLPAALHPQLALFAAWLAVAVVLVARHGPTLAAPTDREEPRRRGSVLAP
jgi:uncharacterized protein